MFECVRKCYIDDGNEKHCTGRLYKPGEFFEGEKAPSRSFKGYVEPAKQGAPKQDARK